MHRHNTDSLNDETDSQLSSTNYNTSEDDEEPYTTTKSSTRKNLPPARNAANARERARMRVLARAFCRLKTTLPWVPADTKLSKLDTLRLATSYIAYLREVLLLDEEKEVQREKEGKKHPVTMSWPFSFGCTSSSVAPDRLSTSCFTSLNHEKSLNNSSSCSQKHSLSLPECRNIVLSLPHNKTNSNLDLHESKVINNNWEVSNSFSVAGIADQHQLMSCQQHGDKEIEVSYY